MFLYSPGRECNQNL